MNKNNFVMAGVGHRMKLKETIAKSGGGKEILAKKTK